ncbi:MAG: acyl carrier protein [Bacteroidales bacterium]|nr:acyl carrier protein [Bacteroidales bacterium]
MEINVIIQEIAETIRVVLDDDSIVVDGQSAPDEINGWDSVTHVSLISAIEAKYGVKLSLRESMSWETLGELAETIAGKIDA